MKKITAILLTLAVTLALVACGAAAPAQTTAAPTVAETAAPETTVPALENAQFTIYSMKGPTSMGLVKLIFDNQGDVTFNSYIPHMVTAADEVTAAIVNGDADIAMLPANAAAALYNKTNGAFQVVAINTLGVLYVVENGETIQDWKDLAGKTIYLTGKGTTPEYGLTYLLNAYGVEDVTLEFKSEAAEVVTALANDTAAIGVLPQPFVTSALMQNEHLRIALSLSDGWDAVSEDSAMVTGVTLVRKEVLETNGPQIEKFMEEYAASIAYVNENVEDAAEWIAQLGIVGKAPIAQKALPGCNLVCISGAEMQTKLSGYLQTLFDANPKAVGGKMPDEGFYWGA